MFDFNKAVELYNNEYSDNKMMQKFIRKLFKFIVASNFVIPVSPHKLMLPDFPMSYSKDILDFFNTEFQASNINTEKVKVNIVDYDAFKNDRKYNK